MNDEAKQARARVERAKRELESAERNLANLERTCQHAWSEPKYTPDVREGYYASNTMGPIRNGKPVLPDVYVPPETTPKWTRTCSKCGLTETTTKTDKHVTTTPRF